jgi:hypothetical protein
LSTAWPQIVYADWQETCAALHLWSQVVGKYRLAHSPWTNHSWHATLYATSRGLTTGLVPDQQGPLTLTLDLRDHVLVAESARGARNSFPLGPMSVADFYDRTKRLIASIGGTPTIHGRPNEMAVSMPFAQDERVRPYDPAAVERFHTALLSVAHVFQLFRTGFIGKVSPVHLFWGSFDLAVTRFSGRRAPLHPGGVPGLPDAVTREAYSHEVSSAGFWPGGTGADQAMFYSYTYPTPEGFGGSRVEPDAAAFDARLGEFLLSYEAVRTANDPNAMLLQFLQSTYEAAAETGKWNRAALECDLGRPGVPRPVS